MDARIDLKAVDCVEILTLQDNYIDMGAQDTNKVIQRSGPFKGNEINNNLLAEHGFSVLVTVHQAKDERALLFDFGFSKDATAFNADGLGVDLNIVEALALSHGHPDHVGGMEKIVERINTPGIPLVLHPAVFRNPRSLKTPDGVTAYFPAFTREKVETYGVTLVETTEVVLMLGGTALFLGQIPRITNFEHIAPNRFYEENGIEKQDMIEDDTSIVFNLKDRGLVIISGCAHSGIVNTVSHAIDVTGIEQIWAIMGGFHLSGAHVDSLLQPTVDALKEFKPKYIIPTHCTGRQAIGGIEKQMPENFIMNMVGTKLTFAT